MQPARLRWLLALIVGLLPALAGAADTYQYDEVGNLQCLTNEAGTRSYTYDEVNRLDQESGPARARNHAYDLNGNRSTDGAGTSATYTASTDWLATINGTGVNLDAAGNLASDGTNTYTWDAAGRLKTVSRANKLWARPHCWHSPLTTWAPERGPHRSGNHGVALEFGWVRHAAQRGSPTGCQEASVQDRGRAVVA
jgi:YD repeat-containing protein